MLVRNDILRRVKNQLDGITYKQLNLIMDVVFEEIIKATSDGESVRLTNFATFEPVEYKEHRVIHPLTGEEMFAQPRKNIRIKTSALWKKKLNESKDGKNGKNK